MRSKLICKFWELVSTSFVRPSLYAVPDDQTIYYALPDYEQIAGFKRAPTCLDIRTVFLASLP